MALSVHARLQVVLGILLGRYHPSSQGIYAVIQVLMDRDTQLIYCWQGLYGETCQGKLRAGGDLMMTLSLGFHIDHNDNLGTGVHQFCLGQHTSALRKIPKAPVNQHQDIAGSGGAPPLAGAPYLTTLDGVSLL